VATVLASSCSRCLRDVEIPLDLGIEEEALPSVELTTGDPLDVDAEPEAIRLTDHHELDLEPLVREAIQLAEPIAPLCRPDCPGLCPECGADLADARHEAHGSDIDPRLAGLAAFRAGMPSPVAPVDPATGTAPEVDGEPETD